MKAVLSVAGLVLTLSGLVWAAVAILIDWRRRSLGALPGASAAKWVARVFTRAPEPNQGTLSGTVNEVVMLTGRAVVQKTVGPSASWQDQIDARVFNLEQWRDEAQAKDVELAKRIDAEQEARGTLAGQVAELGQRVEGTERREHELTRQAKSSELLGVLVALAGAALSGVAGLLPS